MPAIFPFGTVHEGDEIQFSFECKEDIRGKPTTFVGCDSTGVIVVCEGRRRHTAWDKIASDYIGFYKQGPQGKGVSMLKEVTTDVKSFVKEHRQVIYWLGLLLLVDHFVFQDQFRTKLQDLMSKLIGKVEKTLTKE